MDARNVDPAGLRAAFGLPADASPAELEAAMRSDADLIRVSGGREHAAAVAESLAYGSQHAGEPTAGPWMVLESGDVMRAAFSLLELWMMSRADRSGLELTKMTAMNALSHMTKTDVIRVATATAAMAVHVLTADHERERVAERLSLEIAMSLHPHEPS